MVKQQVLLETKSCTLQSTLSPRFGSLACPFEILIAVPAVGPGLRQVVRVAARRGSKHGHGLLGAADHRNSCRIDGNDASAVDVSCIDAL
jgi:hypothetical protein